MPLLQVSLSDSVFFVWYVLFSIFFLFWVYKKRPDFPIRTLICFYIFHTFICLVYCVSAAVNPGSADATVYFRDGGILLNPITGFAKFPIGTSFIVQITAVLRQVFQLNFMSCFLVFNLLGISGILLIYTTIQSYLTHPKAKQYLNYALFLPGFSYWTCALGKDSLFILVVGCVMYGFSDKRGFNLMIGILGLILAFFIRPHVYLLLVLGVFFGFQFSYSKSVKILAIKLIFVLSAAAAIYVAFGFVAKFLKIETVNAETVSMFIQDKESLTDNDFSIANYSLPEKYFAYLFRPLFVDAHNGQMMAASLENLIILLFVIQSLSAWRWFRPFFAQSFGFRFSVFYIMMFVTLFSITNFNLGIACRQKYMVLPSIFFVCLIMLDKRWSAEKQLTGSGIPSGADNR